MIVEFAPIITFRPIVILFAQQMVTPLIPVFFIIMIAAFLPNVLIILRLLIPNGFEYFLETIVTFSAIEREDTGCSLITGSPTQLIPFEGVFIFE